MELRITLSWEEWKGEMEHAAEHLSKDVKVAGFRPGKAPRNVIEQRFGKEALLAEAAEHTVSHSYPKALAKEKIEAIGRPEVTLGKFAEGEALEYSVVTAVMPEVKLASWKDAVKKINAAFAKQSENIDEQEIDAELAKLAEMRAKLVTVNREAKIGDNVLVDFSVLQDGVLIENGKSEKHPLVLGKGVFIPGFEEQLIGMKEGEEQSFELTFPAEYHAKHLAGKPATFQVKMGVVQEREIPAIDDAFAASVGNFESLAKLRDTMRTGMLEEKQQKSKDDRRTEILDALVEKATIEYPEILVQEELVRMMREFEAQIQSLGLDFAAYLVQMKKTEDEVKQEWEPQAKKRIAAQLILGSLAQEEDIDVDSPDVEAEMNKALQSYKDIKDIEKNLDMERLYSAVHGQLRNAKVFAFLESL
ncbi:MAG: trigger factor [Candidatus Moranbacteria bacterium RIFCSPHIGHO2_12_FULL_54_9]|nr:MAG: trigger factor [Candidatus Moranbacteria bacterium RIFCSPHIGHO2_01_FULL_54_31]OGI24849.1 MAG: trigger factor [Candidatus Moranbacteria bacterium RIFCSPHIGHO2_12_FULL_54_9]